MLLTYQIILSIIIVLFSFGMIGERGSKLGLQMAAVAVVAIVSLLITFLF